MEENVKESVKIRKQTINKIRELLPARCGYAAMVVKELHKMGYKSYNVDNVYSLKHSTVKYATPEMLQAFKTVLNQATGKKVEVSIKLIS